MSRLSFDGFRVSSVITLGVVIGGSILVAGGAYAESATDAKNVPKELAERIAAEKEARKACKIEICKAFAAATTGDDIKCAITKTWLRSDILARLVGGSYVWQYGHTQCSVNIHLKRAPLHKAIAEKKASVAIGDHTMKCDVTKKDSHSALAFSTEVKLSPTIEFADGKASNMAFGDVTTKGSTLASAAVSSALALDGVSGLVSSAATKEVNEFLYTKCPDDGVTIARKQ